MAAVAHPVVQVDTPAARAMAVTPPAVHSPATATPVLATPHLAQVTQLLALRTLHMSIRLTLPGSTVKCYLDRGDGALHLGAAPRQVCECVYEFGCGIGLYMIGFGF